jgi:ammonia channel protein AmtB
MFFGLVAIVATLLIDGVPSEKLKGIDTIIEPAMWTALTFFVIRELMWVVEIIRNKMETA